MRTFVAIFVAAGILMSCSGRAAESDRAHEPVVGLPCENCEWAFEGMPDSLAWRARIAPPNEPGVAMRIDGVVRDQAGKPAGNVIVYAYHTNAQGIYPSNDRIQGAARRHGRLRGWARTGADGRYRFDTIRPAGYPNTNVPEHVHMHIIEVRRCTYYIDDIHFEDDPRLTRPLPNYITARGGNGVVKPVKDRDGNWLVTRDIVLGENVPGYPGRQ